MKCLAGENTTKNTTFVNNKKKNGDGRKERK